MRTGIYGGTFDPIHVGHIEPVREAIDRLSLDRVFYLPTAVPPHKRDREFAPAESRFAMVELALLGEERMVVSPFELRQDGPAYTIDTVRHFAETHAEDELFLLIGGDSFAALDSWRNWREIVERCELIVLVRPGWERERTKAALDSNLSRLARGERVHFLGNAPVEVSSTGLRELLAAGNEIPTGVTPELVVQYLRKYSLYR